MKNCVVPVALALAAWAAPRAAAADELGVGDPAPRLAVKEFVKGDPVKSLDKDKTYVVEFWATWCGPCRASIPHLSELQKKYKDVAFIGVSVFESEPKDVKPFVKEMGDKMDYRVAIDEVPAGGKPDEGEMAKNWMEAAGQSGIPTAFIINEGKVAWIGHPMEMDKPLAQIASGKYDLVAAAKEYKAEKAKKQKLRELRSKLVEAQKEGPKALVKVIDKAIDDEPKLEPMLGTLKFVALAGQDGDADKALDYGKHLVEKVVADDPQALNRIAWAVVDPDAKNKPDAKLLKLALQAAQRADELAKSKDGAIADTLAKAYFDNGVVAKAVEAQERAVKLAEGTPAERDPGLKKRLEQYKKALEKK